MTDIQFGKPPEWAYPTIGMLQDTGTPLPHWITVRIAGRASDRIDIDETLLMNEDETRTQIIEAALAQAGDYDSNDFVLTCIDIDQDGRTNVVGYVVREHRIDENFDAWSDEEDEPILDRFIIAKFLDSYDDYDLYLTRMDT